MLKTQYLIFGTFIDEITYDIPFDLLRKKIEIEQPIVDKMITFEFSHFLSPQSIYP